MASLVLSGIGTLVGGPLGGAVGALVGQQIDGAIIGRRGREGPRLKELAVSSSSYGQPLARQFGRVRASGTIIWSTDLQEASNRSGGGKGKPKTTEYSYSISFAVALSSHPIDSVGRIWADGNLLRGSAGDLKSGGSLRIHPGHADQAPDPLMAAHLGDQCPAHRGCAYAVFEDLQLADFGNRIPALSFEVFAGAGSAVINALTETLPMIDSQAVLPDIEGFSHDQGSLAQVLSLVDRLVPLDPRSDAGRVEIELSGPVPSTVPILPEAASWEDGDFGQRGGHAATRHPPPMQSVSALRYYDPARDYQPGLQRADGDAEHGPGTMMEFPGTLAASQANALIQAASWRERAGQDRLSWRLAQLDPALQPGAIVRAPGLAGIWRITSWEWREAGIELELMRMLALETEALSADPGTGWVPQDRAPQPSCLRVFETPWDGVGNANDLRLYAAVDAPAGPWTGAELYAVQGGSLVPIGDSGPARAIGGGLTAELGASSALRFEAAAQMHIALDSSDANLTPATPDALARGANRLLVGAEIIQFAQAAPLGGGAWLVQGLLRGRGGTESAAMAGHPAATKVTLLDGPLYPIAQHAFALSDGGQFAALGLADPAPVLASLENAGVSRQPPFPCHGQFATQPDGALALCWVRRARGGWLWLDEVEQPLVEQTEVYEVGVGPGESPHAVFATTAPSLTLSSATVANLSAAHPGAPVWVRQCGSYAKSAPLLLGAIPTTV